jgi:hypothetical protein
MILPAHRVFDCHCSDVIKMPPLRVFALTISGHAVANTSNIAQSSNRFNKKQKLGALIPIHKLMKLSFE